MNFSEKTKKDIQSFSDIIWKNVAIIADKNVSNETISMEDIAIPDEEYMESLTVMYQASICNSVNNNSNRYYDTAYRASARLLNEDITTISSLIDLKLAVCAIESSNNPNDKIDEEEIAKLIKPYLSPKHIKAMTIFISIDVMSSIFMRDMMKKASEA